MDQPSLLSSIKTPLLVNTDRLKPVPEEFRGVECVHCKRPKTMWALLPSEKAPDGADLDPEPICSRCFMYESGWGRHRADQVKEYIQEVREASKKELPVNADGKLEKDIDCDLIMGSVALFSRMLELRKEETEKVIENPLDAPRIITPQQFRAK